MLMMQSLIGNHSNAVLVPCPPLNLHIEYLHCAQVLEWQDLQRANASTRGFVSTLIGRQRQLPDAQTGSNKAKGHALRAAINTPIQGSAADVATAAMLAIGRHRRLRELGWTLLLQVIPCNTVLLGFEYLIEDTCQRDVYISS